MQKIKKWISGHKKVPKCVGVYDKLYKMIDMGTFDEEGKLPTEPALAKLMGVSRMTLRQAIALLREDGIIKNIHGKGNFLIKDTKIMKKGLEFLQNPVYSSLKYEISNIEIDYNSAPISEYAKKILDTDTDKVLFIDRWYKTEDKKVIAYTLSLITIEILESLKIDYEDRNKLLKFLEEKAYQKSNHSMLKIGVSKTGNVVSSRYSISNDNNFYLIEERIFLPNGKIFLHNKHYIGMDNADLVIDRKFRE